MFTFANRLYDLRKERNLTQEQLSNLTAVPVRSIIRYEKGQTIPSSSTAKNNGNTNLTVLANFFGVFPTWLLTGKGYKNEWEQIQHEAKTNSSVKKALVFQERMKKRSELERCIEEYFSLGKPQHYLDDENLTHEQWEQSWIENKARNDLMNSFFNFMETETQKYKERFGGR